jgi:hypothetical protein
MLAANVGDRQLARGPGVDYRQGGGRDRIDSAGFPRSRSLAAADLA